MNDDLIARARYLAGLWLAGGAALAAVTWLCFSLGLNFATTAFAYLIVIVLLSLLDSLVSSIIFSVIAVGCLSYFFVTPLFTLRIDYAQDAVTLAAFLTASIAVTGLVRRVRQLGEAQSAQKSEGRQEMEDALRYSEHRYHNLFRAMAASFWEIDFAPVGGMLRALRKSGVTDFRAHFAAHPEFVREMMRNSRVIDVNEQTVTTFGRGSKDELLSNVEPFWPDESTHVYAESILASIAGQPHYTAECKLRRIDGTLFDGLFTASFPPATYGKGTLMVGVIDITQRKQALARLEQSQQRYRSLFQAMAMSFWELDFTEVGTIIRRLRASGVTDFRRYFRDNPPAIREVMLATRVVDVNDRTASLFLIDDTSALTTEPFWPEESWQDYAEAIVSSLDHQLNFSVETRLRKLDGTVFDAHFTVWYSGENRSIGLAGVLDITERVRAFAELSQSEQRYRNLFQYMPMSLTQIDASRLVPIYRRLRQEGVTDLKDYLDRHPDFLTTITDSMIIDEVNDHNARMFGAPDQTAMHGPITRYWTARPDTIRRALESLFRGDASFQEETQVVRFDGRTIDVLFSVARPTPVTDKSLVGFLDITALKRAQEMLQQVQAEFSHAARVSQLGELTASIAHEVNQPLAAIAASGEVGLHWLNRPTPNLDETRALMTRIVSDARRAADIIARVRDMATRKEETRSLVSLDEVISEAVLFLGHEIQARGVAVIRERGSPLHSASADRTLLQQVVVNLAMNAMQAMAQSRPRTLRLATALDGDTLRCTVEDSGPGIDAADLTRLFESFFTTKEGGMGMGLPICRSIIEAHGGRIRADNESALGGARFSFWLPVADAPAG